MRRFILPEGYKSVMTLRETESGIKLCKDLFEKELANALNLQRISAPLFVLPGTGLNDNLNGFERPVHFDILDIPGEEAEVVHSLAKWKRMALARYGFSAGEGLYTDMNAIRRDEELDNLHSLYVDQWDWEVIITEKERTTAVLHSIVRKIYEVFKLVQKRIAAEYKGLENHLPDEITFITGQELEDMYPELSDKQREDAITRKYGAVFLQGIGGRLKSGKPHDGRAPDYDDWTLNGDILFYYPVLGISMEMSSMGIRVDKAALLAQVKERGVEERLGLPFHKSLLEGRLPLTAGGGIGQSRMCMYMMNKAHIGEVQASLWSDSTHSLCEAAGIELL